MVPKNTMHVLKLMFECRHCGSSRVWALRQFPCIYLLLQSFVSIRIQSEGSSGLNTATLCPWMCVKVSRLLQKPSPAGSQDFLPFELQRNFTRTPQILPKNEIWQTHQVSLCAKLSCTAFVREHCSTSVIMMKMVRLCCGRSKVIFVWNFSMGRIRLSSLQLFVCPMEIWSVLSEWRALWEPLSFHSIFVDKSNMASLFHSFPTVKSGLLLRPSPAKKINFHEAFV